jgi:hypothetical protein
MLHTQVWQLIVTYALLGSIPAKGKDTELSPAKIQQIKKTRKSYDSCRKEALEQFKNKSINKKKFSIALRGCKENFPGADLYITCKKQAINQARSDGVDEEQAVTQCRRYLIATEFDGENGVPYFTEIGQLYFAGIGLNHSQPVSALNPPNFDCSALQTTFKQPKTSQYLLFGNHPAQFSGFTDLDPKKLESFIKPAGKASKDGNILPGLGKLYGADKLESSVLYFPVAACDYNSDPGRIFSGLSAYYLLDKTGGKASPYFGISYYKPDQKEITTSKILDQLKILLGPEYKIIKKSPHVSFIATNDFKSFDDEKDPKNLCEKPRNHKFIAILQTVKSAPEKPEYLLIANIKNLCDHGDRVSERLVER